MMPPTPSHNDPPDPALRRNLNQPSIAWGIRVPVEDAVNFKAFLPIQGARTWILERAINNFLALAKADPRVLPWAKAQIADMLASKVRLGPMEELSFRLPTELYKGFSEVLPNQGGATWFVRRFIKFLIEETSVQPTVEEVIERTVSRAMMPEIEPDAHSETSHFSPDE